MLHGSGTTGTGVSEEFPARVASCAWVCHNLGRWHSLADWPSIQHLTSADAFCSLGCCSALWRPCPVATQPCPVVTGPCPVVTPPCPVVTPPCPVVTGPCLWRSHPALWVPIHWQHQVSPFVLDLSPKQQLVASPPGYLTSLSLSVSEAQFIYTPKPTSQASHLP